MMGHRQVEQAALFYEFSLEKHIPANHLLRSIDRFVDLEQVRRDLAQFESILRRCIEERLVEGFAVDASLIKADAPRQRCKIARNTDPLRGDFASNSDPS